MQPTRDGLNADYRPDPELWRRCVAAAERAPNGPFLREIATALKWFEAREPAHRAIPREPTPKMLRAAVPSGSHLARDDARDKWRAMYDAAPPASALQGDKMANVQGIAGDKTLDLQGRAKAAPAPDVDARDMGILEMLAAPMSNINDFEKDAIKRAMAALVSLQEQSAAANEMLGAILGKMRERALAAEADARRYRWLRDEPWANKSDEFRSLIINQRNSLWDAAIDAAMGRKTDD